MKIAFYAGDCLPIHARSIEERPLGGIETGVIRLAEALAARGHEVVVFTAMPQPPPCGENPRYIPKTRMGSRREFDLMVVVKDWRTAFYKLPADRLFYWTGDSYDQYVNFGLGDLRVVERYERFLAVSEWHARTMCEESGFPRQKAAVIGNGIHLPYFEGREERARKRLIYSSAPYRGLAFVPKFYLRLHEKHPELELHVFSGLNVYDTDKPFQGPEQEQWQRIRALLVKLPGCTVFGNVRQQPLARAFMRSSVLFYPNVFVETSCITAMEALAGGCPVISSSQGGLIETVAGCGMLIPGMPNTTEYEQAFVEAADLLLSDDELWSRLSEEGRLRAQAEFGWERVAERFEAVL